MVSRLVIVVTVLAVLFTIAQQAFKLLLHKFVPSVSVSRIRFFSVGGITWTSPPKAAASRHGSSIKVNIGNISWALRSGGGTITTSSKEQSQDRAFVVLRIQDVVVNVPKAYLLASSEPAAPTEAKSIRSVALKPLLPFIPFLSLFRIEVSFRVEIQDILSSGGNMFVGASMSQLLSEQRITGYVGLHGITVKEATKTLNSSSVPALSIKEPVTISASAPVSLPVGQINPASVKVSAIFSPDKEGLHFGSRNMKKIIKSFNEVSRERRRTNHGHLKPAANASEDGPQTQEFKPQLSIIDYIRSVEVSVPLVTVSAHYTMPQYTQQVGHENGKPIPSSIGFVITLKGFGGKIWLGGTSEAEMVNKDHRAWLGKARKLAWSCRFNWDEIDGRVMPDSSEDDLLPDSSKTFSVSRSQLLATSTWVPPGIHKARNSVVNSPINFNDFMIITEINIGMIRGHTSFEILDHAIQILKSRPQSMDTSENSKSDQDSFLEWLPKFVGNFTTDGTDLRIQAPEATTFIPRRDESISSTGTDHDHGAERFYRTWSSPDVLSISLPRGTLSFETDYVDLSLARTDAERRAAKKYEKNRGRSGSVNALKDFSRAKAARSSTPMPDSLISTIGALPPAPPPIIHVENPPVMTAAGDLDTHSISYNITYRLYMEELNMCILSMDEHEEFSDDSDSDAEERRRNERRQSIALPSDPIRYEILEVGPFLCSGECSIKGSEDRDQYSAFPVLNLSTRIINTRILIETIGIDLWRPVVIGCIRDFLVSLQTASTVPSASNRAVNEYNKKPCQPLVRTMPVDVGVYFSIGTIDTRIAGMDPKSSHVACRGIAFHTEAIVFQYLLSQSPSGVLSDLSQRHSLELLEDIHAEAKNFLSVNPHKKQAIIRLQTSKLNIDPVLDARFSKGYTRRFSMGAQVEEEGDYWELKNRSNIDNFTKRRRSILATPTKRGNSHASTILYIPSLDFDLKIKEVEEQQEDGALDDIGLVINFEPPTVRIELFSIYICLVSISTLRNFIQNSSLASREPKPSPRPSPLLTINTGSSSFHFFLTLPGPTPLYLHFQGVRVRLDKKGELTVNFSMLLVAVICPAVRGKWDALLRLRSVVLTLNPTPPDDPHGMVVSLESESAQLRIPFRYMFSQVLDNIANLVKAVKQLFHQLVKGKDDWVLEPEVEAAKLTPKIKFAINTLAIEFQDDPIETRLNIIWRAGKEEQLARLERQEAFEEKVQAIQQMANGVDGDEKNRFNGNHSIPIEEAREELMRFDFKQWERRMKNAVSEQARREEVVNRKMYGGKQAIQRPDPSLPIDLLPTSRVVPMARATFHDLFVEITRPSFGGASLQDFLYDVGKGLPRETEFSLLVPLHISWKMEEARCQLRDYPLLLLHLPPMTNDTAENVSSFELETDLVVAEEMLQGEESIRRVDCPIIPPHLVDRNSKGYSISIPRTATATKTYALPIVKVCSSFATRIGWGNSMQPAVQDVVRVIDTLTKPAGDPSERIGFWDKLRLAFHWRIKILFEGDGPVNIHMKGTRDPYCITGFGAGFVMSWRKNVQFLIGYPNEDNEFFQIISDEFILGIPNLREYMDAAASGLTREIPEDDRSTLTGDTGSRRAARLDADLIKICAKFTNGVRWGLGTVLERACTDKCENPECVGKDAYHRQCRYFDFAPHWKVLTKSENARDANGQIQDSFAGFRSDFIHFSISITSPLVSSSSSSEDSSNGQKLYGYNSIHATPQASTHFWAWWHLFDSSASLPIRNGKLFPSTNPPSKKFGRHCATIKYRFSLSPLFISHVYREESWNDWADGHTNTVGIKAKIDTFHVDLHMRDQEDHRRNADTHERKLIRHKVFYQASVDIEGLDIRALAARFLEPEKRVVHPEAVGVDPTQFGDTEKFTSSYEDNTWIDLDDYMDVTYTFPDHDPSIRVIPVMGCPRFSYYRQTDVTGPNGEEDPLRVKRKFGKENSHTCLMGTGPDTITIQLETAHNRLEELQAMARKESSTDRIPQSELLIRINAVQQIIERLRGVKDCTEQGHRFSQASRPSSSLGKEELEDSHANARSPEWNEWVNRHMVHNPTIQLTNDTRDILLKYFYSNRQRKGLMYHMSAKAIKFIRDLSKEADRQFKPVRRKFSGMNPNGSIRNTTEFKKNFNKLLDNLLQSSGSFWDNSGSSHERSLDVDPSSAGENLPEKFDLRSRHLFIFIKPQILLKSTVDDASTVILSAFRAQLKGFTIIDMTMLDDPINKNVMTQTYVGLDGLQAFYPRDRHSSKFVPLETMVDLRIEPWGFDRLVPKTSAQLRYDQYNQLRISSLRTQNDGSSEYGSSINRIAVECERFSVSANPQHFTAIFNVITDLVLYNDPAQSSKTKKIEDLVFTHNFSDYNSICKLVSDLQARLRHLLAEAVQFQLHIDELDEDGRMYLFQDRAEVAKLSDELNLVVQAISRAQDFHGNKSKSRSTPGVQFEARASELVWHMHDKEGIPFAKFSVNGVEFSWVNRKDSSVSNQLVIKDLRALNSSPDHIFAEIISKYDRPQAIEENALAKLNIFTACQWNALAPVGGISIVEQFEIHLHPIRLQLEHRVGRMILDYLFVENQKNAEESEGKPSPAESKVSLVVGSQASKSAESLLLTPSSSASIYGSRPVSIKDGHSGLYLNANLSRPRFSQASSAEGINTQHALEEEGLDAEEMRRRASMNRTFILVDFSPTWLCLTYRSEKDDHSQLPNIYDITYRTASMQYRNKTWSFLDLLNEIKKDTIKSVWSQKGALIGQLLSTAHRRLPLQDARSAAKKSIKTSFKSKLTLKPRMSTPPVAGPSPLRREKPDTLEEEDDEGVEQSQEKATNSILPIRIFHPEGSLISDGASIATSSPLTHEYNSPSPRSSMTVSREDSILAGLETGDLRRPRRRTNSFTQRPSYASSTYSYNELPSSITNSALSIEPDDITNLEPPPRQSSLYRSASSQSLKKLE